jgi:Mce-associated membrane protein
MGTDDVTPATPTPTWYDVLGVPREATPEEIKAAWRHATDRFEPGSGSGQFRMFNDAADVLLDPERRRAYDATLDRPTPAPGPHASVQSPEFDTRTEAQAEAEDGRVQDVPPAAEPPVPAEEDDEEGTGFWAGVTRTLGGLSAVTLSVLAALTVAVLVLVVVLGIKVQQEAAVQSARDEAPAAAESAVKALFSYDYRNLDADRKRAQGYMDPAFAKKYLQNFDALKKQKDGTPGLAVQAKAVVDASVQSSGVVDAESDVARVLVFVNVVSRKAGGDPQIFQNRVAVTMRKHGDRWLVSNVNSY